MALFIEYFRREILRRPTDRKGITLGNIHFGQAKISKSEIANFIDEDVLWLEAKDKQKNYSL